MSAIWIADDLGRTWIAGGPDVSTPLVRNQLTKAVGDTVTLAMDFGDIPELWTDPNVVVSCTVAGSPSGLTISAIAVNTAGYAVSASFAGGTAATTYTVTFTATLSTGDVISRAAILNVV